MVFSSYGIFVCICAIIENYVLPYPFHFCLHNHNYIETYSHSHNTIRIRRKKDLNYKIEYIIFSLVRFTEEVISDLLLLSSASRSALENRIVLKTKIDTRLRFCLERIKRNVLK